MVRGPNKTNRNEPLIYVYRWREEHVWQYYGFHNVVDPPIYNAVASLILKGRSLTCISTVLWTYRKRNEDFTTLGCMGQNQTWKLISLGDTVTKRALAPKRKISFTTIKGHLDKEENILLIVKTIFRYIPYLFHFYFKFCMNFPFLFQILHEFSNNIFTWKLKISQCYWEIRFKLHMSIFKIPPIFVIVLWRFHPESGSSL